MIVSSEPIDNFHGPARYLVDGHDTVTQIGAFNLDGNSQWDLDIDAETAAEFLTEHSRENRTLREWMDAFARGEKPKQADKPDGRKLKDPGPGLWVSLNPSMQDCRVTVEDVRRMVEIWLEEAGLKGHPGWGVMHDGDVSIADFAYRSKQADKLPQDQAAALERAQEPEKKKHDELQKCLDQGLNGRRHAQFVLSRLGHDGKVRYPMRLYKINEKAARRIERELGLTVFVEGRYTWDDGRTKASPPPPEETKQGSTEGGGGGEGPGGMTSAPTPEPSDKPAKKRDGNEGPESKNVFLNSQSQGEARFERRVGYGKHATIRLAVVDAWNAVGRFDNDPAARVKAFRVELARRGLLVVTGDKASRRTKQRALLVYDVYNKRYVSLAKMMSGIKLPQRQHLGRLPSIHNAQRAFRGFLKRNEGFEAHPLPMDPREYRSIDAMRFGTLNRGEAPEAVRERGRGGPMHRIPEEPHRQQQPSAELQAAPVQAPAPRPHLGVLPDVAPSRSFAVPKAPGVRLPRPPAFDFGSEVANEAFSLFRKLPHLLDARERAAAQQAASENHARQMAAWREECDRIIKAHERDQESLRNHFAAMQKAEQERRAKYLAAEAEREKALNAPSPREQRNADLIDRNLQGRHKPAPAGGIRGVPGTYTIDGKPVKPANDPKPDIKRTRPESR